MRNLEEKCAVCHCEKKSITKRLAKFLSYVFDNGDRIFLVFAMLNAILLIIVFYYIIFSEISNKY